MVSITQHFDSGNIEVVDASDPMDIRLAIRRDTGSDFLQWFHFRASAPVGAQCRFRIVNAGQTSYPKGWEGYKVRRSDNLDDWYWVEETAFDGQELVFSFRFDRPSCWFAYFAPYSYERHLFLMASAQQLPHCGYRSLGQTVQDRDIDLLRVGEELPGRKKVWLIGRQHPGEPQASWFMEGVLDQLLFNDDALGHHLLDKAVFYVVPHMNPDGAVLGNLRSNAAGVNLNRAWAEPSPVDSPEVFHVLAEMDLVGLDFLLDVHADEELPYVFVSGMEGVPGYAGRLEGLQSAFCQAWLRHSPDFQTERGYKPDPAGQANLSIASNQVAHRFGKLALTLEMPFKENANLPNPGMGWSPNDCMALGETFLLALDEILDRL